MSSMDSSSLLASTTTCRSPEDVGHQRGILAVRDVKSDAVEFLDNTETSSSALRRYIPYGDPWNEYYRLATFAQFVSDTPVKVWSLAKAGFLHTGFQDEAMCFSCGKVLADWIESDNPLSPLLHNIDCDMAHGRDAWNIPRPTRDIFQGRQDAIQCNRSFETTARNQRLNQNMTRDEEGCDAEGARSEDVNIVSSLRHEQDADIEDGNEEQDGTEASPGTRAPRSRRRNLGEAPPVRSAKIPRRHSQNKDSD